jgi:phosphatidylserine/phosphatidylglycerophosphate/cardiolipin synthase-like enzyme
MSSIQEAIARVVIEGDPVTLLAFAHQLPTGARRALAQVEHDRPSTADPHTLLLLDELARLLDAPEVDPRNAADMIDVAVRVRDSMSSSADHASLVWTGPELHESPMRSTARALADLIDNAQSQILLVTYSFRSELRDPERTLVARLARARRNGVGVTLVLHKDEGNRRALERSWPAIDPSPRLLTWPIPEGDEMVKLHAKIAVADDRNLLVSSANLTYHGLFANLELGILISGAVAGDVRRHFDRLERNGHLLEWQ